MMDLYYSGAQTGERINLICGDFAAQNVETLLKNSWTYTSLGAIDNRTVIKSFRKTAEERKLEVQVLADTEDEYNCIMADAHRVFDSDVRAKTPGKLWCNGYYMDAYMVGETHESFVEFQYFVKKTLRFLLPYPFWTREISFSFLSGGAGSSGKIDFPLDFPHDLGKDAGLEMLTNDSIGSSKFRMVIYGPCSNPSVTLAGHEYDFVGLTVESGGYVVIDSREKTTYLVDAGGNRSNAFDYRDRDSYIFEPIPPGDILVSRFADVGIDVTIYDERGLPPWI